MENLKDKNPLQLRQSTDALLEDAAEQLRHILCEVAGRLRPFPPFLNMVSVQAVELEPPLRPGVDRGCVVVSPEGEICQLELTTIAGIAGVAEVEAVEQMQELDLPAGEYLVYASHAIRLLTEELGRRGLQRL